VQWSSVDTDPTDFSILLVNFANYPPFYVDLAPDIPTSAGQQVITIPCDVASLNGYQM
jgi:hypothetical protein